MANIAILVLNREQQARALQLAEQLKLPLVDDYSPQYAGYLLLNEQGLGLQTDINMNAIYVDFLTGALAHRIRYGGGKSQLIAKAIGLKNKANPKVLDLTAGLGRDAFVLANLGCNVSLVERSPIIAALLQDGLERARLAGNSSIPNLSLITEDAKDYLAKLNQAEKPDVIYLDPMFTALEKSALVKKEMRILREVVGDDMDANLLLNLALEQGCKRVVVKRHRLAPLLNEVKPSFQVLGKSTRFDVYLT